VSDASSPGSEADSQSADMDRGEPSPTLRASSRIGRIARRAGVVLGTAAVSAAVTAGVQLAVDRSGGGDTAQLCCIRTAERPGESRAACTEIASRR
jgi:hypothetical protein